jgi:putative phage-type endonuclease
MSAIILDAAVADVDRSRFIGGSDAAAVLGISPWRTPLDLYMDKVHPRETEGGDNLAAKLRGKRLEPYICDMLAAEHGIKLIARNVRQLDPQHYFLSCEIDAVTDHGENVEIKTVHPFKAKEWGDELTDSIPVHYTAQAMHGLMITGRNVCKFAVLIGDELRLYRVDRDPEIILAMRAKEVAFWRDHVMPRIPPPATNSSDVLRLFERDLGTVLEANAAIAGDVRRLQLLKAEEKEFKEQIEACEERIKLFMQGASSLTYDGRVLCTWKTQTSKRFNQAEFGRDNPELYESYKRELESRVFRIR